MDLIIIFFLFGTDQLPSNNSLELIILPALFSKIVDVTDKLKNMISNAKFKHI